MAVPNISRSHVIQKVLQNNFNLPLFILISGGEKSLPPPFFLQQPNPWHRQASPGIEPDNSDCWFERQVGINVGKERHGIIYVSNVLDPSSFSK